MANTTTEPRAVGADAAPAKFLEVVSTAVPLMDEVDARDGFLRAGTGVDTARPEKALASMVREGERGERGGEEREGAKRKTSLLCSRFQRGVEEGE